MQTETLHPSHPSGSAQWARPWWDLSGIPPGRRVAVIAAFAVAFLLFAAGFVTILSIWRMARKFPTAPFSQPSRLYARAEPLAPGAPATAGEIVDQLTAAGYREAADDAGRSLQRGELRRTGDRVAVHLRHFPTAQGDGGGLTVEIEVKGGRVSRLWVAGRPAASTLLEPPLLASYYGRKIDERRPVRLAKLPERVVRAVLAAEDDSFYLHPGISPGGILRALWVDLKGKEVQGGSTITQQLVKNLYLSNARTFKRKAKEAVIAVALEASFGKQRILEAYLNEIYWGRSGPANLIGLGAAARAYFGKDPGELTLGEAATLAGMIRGPSDYSPLEHPDRATERRNRVLQHMAELGWIGRDQAAAAEVEPLAPHPQTVAVRNLAPYFAAAAETEARERFGIADLADQGFELFSTIGWREQRQAESAVSTELAALGRGLERRHRGDEGLQAALLSIDPHDGRILAWVGGRDYQSSQFDRVTQAHRQAGSAFKPVVYAAAFSEAAATPATLLRDSPIVVRVGADRWEPQNYDRSFRGWVTARAALEQSLNVPTVRLALQVGLSRVADLARELGIEGELRPSPALALGSCDVTPHELTTVYATLASGGLRPSLHGLAAVRDRAGDDEAGKDLPAPKRVLPAQIAWVVTSMLQGVVDHGTGAGVRAWLPDPLAGKTGTTNDRRDNWFAGYAPDRTTVVWVGYDDNSRTHLSGATAALPIWGRFMAAVRPPGGYPALTPPPGMQEVEIDPLSGELATPDCPYKVKELLPDWQVPVEPCHLHGPGGANALAEIQLNGEPIDLATGLPVVDPYGREGAVDTGGGDPGAAEAAEPPAMGVAPPAAEITPTDASVVIRPAQRPKPPAPTTQIPAPEPTATPPEPQSEDTPPPPRGMLNERAARILPI